MNWTREYLSIILILFLTGCATNPIDFSKTKPLPQGEAIVFGRVNVIYKGEPKVWKGIPPYTPFQILVLPTASKEAYSFALLDDGSFYWHLSPGSYAISGFQWTGGSGGGTKSGRIFAEFVVPEDKSLVYIGKLTLDFDRTYHYTMRIENDYERAIQNFKNKFPEIKDEPTQNLMKFEVLK